MTKKKKNIKKWVEYGLIGLVIVLFFTTSIKAEVFGFLQRGFLALGLFKPDTEQAAQPKNSDVISRDTYNFPLIDQNGVRVNMSEFGDQVIFVNFWATWCAPCVAEMPNINSLYQDYDTGKEVVFIMISLDKDFSKAKDFVKRKGFDFNVYKAAGPYPAIFDPASIPTTYVLAKNGELAMTHAGIGNYDTADFRGFLDKLIREKN